MKNFFGLMVVMLLLAACNSTSSGEIVEFNIEMREYSFSPDTITVNANQKVRLNILNKGNIEHDWAIIDIPLASTPKIADTSSMMHSHEGKVPAIHFSAIPGTKNTAEFTPTTPGTYEVYCSLTGHKDQGMVGKLIVK
jgi:uncharacterized cupredoxin-like copper-binding protein